MWRQRFTVALHAAVFILITYTTALVLGSELPSTILRIKPSIVGIGTVQKMRRPLVIFLGTGFVVADGHHVITNAHTIDRDIRIEKGEYLAVVTSENKGGIRRAKTVRVDEVHDLVLLRFDGKALPTISLGNSNLVREGEIYAFTGFPIGMVLGLRPVTHRGIVSAITPIAIPQISSRQLDVKMIQRLRNPYKVFQLDATAYPGNSGSPLYHPASGEVIGVINKVFVKETKEKVLEKPSGITYAIPIRYAKELLQKTGLPTD